MREIEGIDEIGLNITKKYSETLVTEELEAKKERKKKPADRRIGPT